MEVFEAALQGNTIAVLDTGSGKTMVAVLLARHHVGRVRAGEVPRRIVVFLAPTVHLVHQVRFWTLHSATTDSRRQRLRHFFASHSQLLWP